MFRRRGELQDDFELRVLSSRLRRKVTTDALRKVSYIGPCADALLESILLGTKSIQQSHGCWSFRHLSVFEEARDLQVRTFQVMSNVLQSASKKAELLEFLNSVFLVSLEVERCSDYAFALLKNFSRCAVDNVQVIVL